MEEKTVSESGVLHSEEVVSLKSKCDQLNQDNSR